MDEIEKIKYAKLFIDKLAQGINPIDDVPVAEYDVVNNVRLSRLFFYVSDILRQIIDNGGIQNKKEKIDFSITKGKLAMFKFSEEPIPLSLIAKELNALVDTNKYKKIQYKDLANWLISENILIENIDNKGKKYKLFTEKGKNLGLVLDIRQSSHQREYSVILYNKKAQMFIINNLDKILSLKYGY